MGGELTSRNGAGVDDSGGQQCELSDVRRQERNAQIRMCVNLLTVLTYKIMRSAPAQSHEAIVDDLIEDHVDSTVPKELITQISAAKLVCHFNSSDNKLKQKDFRYAYGDRLRTIRDFSAEKIQQVWDAGEQPRGMIRGSINTNNRFQSFRKKAKDAQSARQIAC